VSDLRIVYLAASPLGTPAPVRVREEWTALLSATSRSGRQVRLQGINPASVAELVSRRRDGEPRPVLLVAAHGDAERLELEREDGGVQTVSARGLAEAIAAFDPQLVVLNGCHTEPFIDEIARCCNAQGVIGCDGFVSDHDAVRYIDVLMRQLLAHGDIRRAHRHAVGGMAEQGGAQVHHLAGGGQLGGLRDGQASAALSFLQTQRRATAVERLVGRDGVLAQAWKTLGDPSQHVTWVSGPPQSGVSRVLRALAARYAWCFDQEPLMLDLRAVAQQPDPNVALAEVLAGLEALEALEGTAPRPLPAMLEGAGALVALDHWDALEPDDAKRLWDALQGLSAQCTSHVLIGSSPGAARAKGAQRLSLLPLSVADAAGLVRRELPDFEPGAVGRLVEALPRWPGRLLLAVEDLRNGASIEDVTAADRAGDFRIGFALPVRRMLEDADVRATVAVMQLFGGEAPRRLVSLAIAALWRQQDATHDPTARLEAAFSALRDADALRVEFTQGYSQPDLTPEARVQLDPDVLAVAARELDELRPSPLRAVLGAAIPFTAQRLERHELDPLPDARWLIALLQRLSAGREHTELLRVVRPLLERDGDLRRRGAPRDMETLATFGLEAARHENDRDLVGYYSLLVGEGHYKRGDLEGAEQTFRRGLGFDIAPDRQLQLLRALAQVEYRRKHYEQARDLLLRPSLCAPRRRRALRPLSIMS
jgi:hypothetical protein